MSELAVQKVTIRQKRAVAALLTSTSLTEALNKADVSRSAWARWQSIPAFQDFLAAAVAESFAASLLEAKLAHAEAIKKLRELIQHPNPGIALSASNQLVVYGLRIASLVDQRRRIEALEEKVGLRKARNGSK